MDIIKRLKKLRNGAEKKALLCKHDYKYFEKINISSNDSPVWAYVFVCKECGREIMILGETIQKISNKISYEYCKKVKQYNCNIGTSYTYIFKCMGWYRTKVNINNPFILVEIYNYFNKKYKINILEISKLDISKIMLQKDYYDPELNKGSDDNKYRFFCRERLIFKPYVSKFKYYFINYDGNIISISDIDVQKHIHGTERKIKKNKLMNKDFKYSSLKEWFDKKYFKDSLFIYENAKLNYYNNIYYDG